MARRIVTRDSEGWISSFEGRRVLRASNFYPRLPEGRQASVVQIRGCNGSGKSSIPMALLERGDSLYITTDKDDRKPTATYLPEQSLLILGLYLSGTNCGGCDSIDGPQEVYKVLRSLWNATPDIIFEGVIIGDNKIQTYNHLLEINEQASFKRDIQFCFMDTSLEECLRRISIRNEGKTFKPELVDKKFKAQQRYRAFLMQAPGVKSFDLSTQGTKADVLSRFLEAVDFQPDICIYGCGCNHEPCIRKVV